MAAGCGQFLYVCYATSTIMHIQTPKALPLGSYILSKYVFLTPRNKAK